MFSTYSKPQRQLGVKMIRIKLPFGRIDPNQLKAIAEVSEKYSNGVLHTTTRQDIQLHYVESDKVEELWSKLESQNVDGRETFGNTIRNITASSTAGVDIHEAFDVTPYAKAVDSYFRKAEINTDLGRKVKIAFSSNEKDSAYTFMNDIGFIPTIENDQKGFKVFLGGGMAGRSIKAKYAIDFLPAEKLLNFIECVLRVFSQHGELLNRNKARLKFLIEKIGIDEFLGMVQEEMQLMRTIAYKIEIEEEEPLPKNHDSSTIQFVPAEFQKWLVTNTAKQKQPGYHLVNIKLSNGDITSQQAIELSDIIEKYASSDIRITSNQGIQLKYVGEENLIGIFVELQEIGLGQPGFNSAVDVTACPGTDTCNLGIANTTNLSTNIEELISSEFDELVYDHDLKIKISGCMNACGHHTVASIGLQATTIKHENTIYPGMHILLGGGVLQDGSSNIAEKLIVVPSRKVPNALSILLHDFRNNSYEGEYFNDYYRRQEKMYFFQLLLEVSKISDQSDAIDWGQDEKFQMHKPIKMDGAYSVIQQLENELLEKENVIEECLKSDLIEDAIFHAYMLYVRFAKIKLLEMDIQCGTQMKILEEFETQFSNRLPDFLKKYKEHALSYKRFNNQSFDSEDYIQKAMDLKNIIN